MTHSHHTEKYGRAFAFAIALNLAFVLIEFLYGLRAGSLALIADAGHNLSDVASLVLAWAGLAAARLKSDSRHTYGWRRGSILASFFNAVLLLVTMGALAWEAISRLQTPVSVDGATVMTVAGIGILINGFTAFLFMRGSKHDLNIQGAFLHMAADTLVSVGVVLGGAITLATPWTWIHPVLGIAIAVVVIVGTWSLFRQSLHLLFDGVPADFNLALLNDRLLQLHGVSAVHDLHVWAMSTTEYAVTAHIVLCDDKLDRSGLLSDATSVLRNEFGLNHVTLQIEPGSYAKECNLVNCVDQPAIGTQAPPGTGPGYRATDVAGTRTFSP